MPRSREILLPWDRQPQEAVEIDWSNPITQGLTVAITNSGGVPYDAVRGVPLTTTFGSVPTGETTNKGVTTKGAGGGWVYAAPGSAPTGVSDFCVVRISSADNYGGIFAHAAVGGATGNGGIQRDALTNELICFNRTSGGSGVATTGSAYSTVTNGNFHSLGLTVSGVTVSIYLDGLLNRSANDSVSQETLASERLVLFGERGASASFGSDGNYLVHLTWARILSADEYAWLHQNYWQLFAPQTIPVPVSAGGGGTTGTAATTNANDTPSASGTTTVTGTSSKTNANDTSSASGTTTVVGTSAKTNANDVSAASGTTTVIGTLAKTNADDTSAASGTVGSSGTTGTVAATNANDTAAASGTTKIVGTLSTTNANDAATASGVAGAVSGTVAVTNANDTASAVGDAGAPVASGAGMGFSMSRMRRLVKIQFNGKLYQAFEEDIPELLETLEEQAEQKIKKKRNARAKPAPVATVVSAPADVLPSLQSRIDDVNHSIGVLWGVDEDEDEELLWLML